MFAAYAVDPARVAIGGFSDGASYALTLGLANGDVLRTILAVAPGFEKAPRRVGTPHIYIAHGLADAVLPISWTRNRLVPSLQRAGLRVTFEELDGGHAVPVGAVHRALALL